jgi:hypothetical protein
MRVLVALLCLVAGAALALTAVSTTKVKLTTSSSPAGIFASSETTYDAGSTVSIASPAETSNGYTFAYWYLAKDNSTPEQTRQADDYGMSLTALNLKIYENTSFVAVYVPSAQDTGSTGIPDWFRLRHYGTTNVRSDNDSDGDGLTLAQEYQKGSLPRIPDNAQDGGILQGGVSRRRGEKLAVVVGSQYHLYTETSNPPGIVNRSQYVSAGTQMRSANAQPEIQGYRFAQWKVNGVRQENENGTALNQVLVNITGPTDVVAEYVLSTQDTGNTGIPDWYRLNQYGTLNISPTSDSDGDGRSLAQEYADGTQPRIADSASDGSILQGGVSRRRGAKLPLPLSPAYVHYVEASDPPGILTRDTYLTNGTLVTTPNAQMEVSGYKFTHWTINGVRKESDAGIAISQVTFTLDGDTQAVAHYMLGALDSDLDGLPDWYEMLQYSVLWYGATSDTDKDGVSFLAEYLMGSQPRIPDSAADGGILQGGVSRRRGEKFVLNLQFFPASQATLTGGTGFFSDPYSGASGGFKMAGGSSAPAVGDLDGDGDLDLLIGGAGGRLRLFKNTGSPFAPELTEVSINLSSLKDWPTGNVYPALGDWNADGKADLVVGSDDGLLRFYRATGTASLFEWVSTLTATATANAASLHPGFYPTANGLSLLALDGTTGKVLLFSPNASSPLPYAVPASNGDLLGSDNAIPNGSGISIADTNNDGLPDLIASDTDGRIWRFLGQAGGTFVLESKVFGGAFSGFRPGLSAAVADFDGDGSPDIIGGGTDGALVFLRNPGRHLRLTPSVATVRAGESVAFTSIDNDGTFVWKMGPNQSGATLQSGGTYTAGNKAGVDQVVAMDNSGHIGVAWVNVIPNTPSSGHKRRALLVDGRRSPNDPISSASNGLAKRAREVLLYRGLQESEILWLGNGGKANAKPTRTALMNALLNEGAVDADTEALTIFLADHGRKDSSGDGVFLLSENESVSGTELNTWLNQLQSTHPKVSVVVLVECCYGGRVSGALARSGLYSARRLVFSSCGSDELAHLAANGSVSYSMMWWSALASGKTFAEAHTSASLAMAGLQTPQMSSGADTLASTKLGLENVPGSGRPVVTLVGNDISLHGVQQARITVDVKSARPLEKVTALVIAPGYTPEGDSPVTGLKEVALALDEATGRWTEIVDGFSESGAPYTVLIQAKDIWGQVSMPAVLHITQEQRHNRLIIFAAGRANWTGAWAAAELAAYAQYVATQLHMRPEDTLFVCEKNMGTSQTQPSIASLKQALEWANKDGNLGVLNLFLLGQGTTKGIVCANGDIITPAALKTQLDALQTNDTIVVQMMVDADYSGIFLRDTANPLKNRISLTSTTAEDLNEVPDAGTVYSMTGWLLDGFARGMDLRKSFDEATRLTERIKGKAKGQIDDNGDGNSNTSTDGLVASKAHLTTPYATADDPPFIGKASPTLQVASGKTARFWVSNVVMPDGNLPKSVWGQVFGPDNSSRGTVQLWRNELKDRYEGSFQNFKETGRYLVVIQAGELYRLGKTTPPAIVQVNYGATPNMGGPASGTLPTLAMPTDGQLMDVEKETGAQWSVDLKLGQRIVVEAVQVTTQRDVSLQLIGGDNKILVSADKWGKGFGESISDWEVPADGKYIIRATFASGRGNATCKVRTHVKYDAGGTSSGTLLPQSITFGAIPDRTLNQGSLKLSASASSGLPVRFELTEGTGTLLGGTLTPTSAGTFTIRALQDGNAQWDSAEPVTRSLVVSVLTTVLDGYDDWARGIFGADFATKGGRTQDPDGDGQSNEAEWLAHTSPVSAQDVLRVLSAGLNPNGFTLRWLAREGVNYRVMQSRDLVNWTPAATSLFPGHGTITEFTDVHVEDDSKYYRVEVVP